jgi:microcystin degradation protein MlrC
MRIAVGCFAQESNSFSPVPGSWLHFGPQELLRGWAVMEECAGTKTELSGALDIAKQHQIELVPLIAARASASAGTMCREVFETIRDELLEHLRKAGPLDGVFLALHGAMVAEDYEDATGEVLRALRAEIGPDLPLVGTLDLHANVTQRMISQATALVGYHTAPHIDLYETGQRGMELLLATVKSHVQPVTALRRLPMLLPAENGRTTDGPYAEVMGQVKTLEKCHGILDVSVFSVQPWLDIHDVGCSVVVITDGDHRLAEKEADRLADEFWKRRRAFNIELTPTSEAICYALEQDQFPFILSDSADATSSGAPGDSTVVLEALLNAQPTKDCYLNIVDPQVVEEMIQAGVGQEVTLRVGAKYAPALYRPVEVTGWVKLISDGDFVQKGPGLQGITVHRGRTGVLRVGHVYLVVMERPVIQWDAELYRSVGLEPRDAQIVVVKSPAAFRAAYEPFAAEILILDASGVCSPNLLSLPFKHVRRPLYPLDEFEDWRIATTAHSAPCPSQRPGAARQTGDACADGPRSG